MRATPNVLIVHLLLATTCQAAQAAEWKIDPTLRFRAGYNDNIRLSANNEISSAEATFSPSAVFSVATPTSGASGNVGFDFRRFEADSNLNDNNSRLTLNTFHTLERTRLGLDLGFIKDTTLDSQLQATGIAFDRIRRQRLDASPNWTYSLDERTQISANYGYNDVKYKNAGNSGFVDFTSNSVQTSLTHVLSERATASITLSGSKSDSSNSVKSLNTGLQGGASYRFSETLSGSLFVGIRRTQTDFSRTAGLIPTFDGNTIIFVPVTEDISNSNFGATFSAGATKTFLRAESSVSASRDISNDVNGQPIEVTQLRWTGLYHFTEILSGNLNLTFYNSQSNNTIGSGLNQNYYQIEPTFSWALQRFWNLSGSYRYRKQTFDSTNKDAIQNAAYLTLTYRWPRIAASR